MTHLKPIVRLLLLCSLNDIVLVAALPRANELIRCQATSYYYAPMDLTTYVNICENGRWPTKSDPILEMPPLGKAISLNIENVQLQRGSFQPIPPTPGLKVLQITSLSTIGQNGEKVRFPLDEFTQLLDHSTLKSLHLSDVLMGAVDANSFNSFPMLTKLDLENCDIATFHLQALEPLRLLDSFYINEDQVLEEFNWDTLRPVSETLKTLRLGGNSRLSSLAYSTGAPALTLKKQLYVYIAESNLTTLPQNVISSLDFMNSDNYGGLQFERNKNRCGTCDLAPLIRWAKANAERALRVTCMNTTTGAFDGFPTSGQYWQTVEISPVC